MPALDADVLVRWLVNHDQSHAAVVRRLIESAIRSQESRFIAITVLLELAWVLRTRYRVGRTSIELALAALLEARELSMQSEGSVEFALPLFRQSNADLADCLHVGLSAMRGRGHCLPSIEMLGDCLTRWNSRSSNTGGLGQSIQPTQLSIGQGTAMSARKMAESLDVAAAEMAAMERSDRCTLARAVDSHRELIGQGPG